MSDEALRNLMEENDRLRKRNGELRRLLEEVAEACDWDNAHHYGEVIREKLQGAFEVKNG